MQVQNQYSDYLIDLSFQGVNRFLVLSFKHNAVRTSHTGYFLPKIEIEKYNVIINVHKFFDLPVKNDTRTDANITKIVTGQGDDYTNGCLLDYGCFKENNMLIVIDLSKQQALKHL